MSDAGDPIPHVRIAIVGAGFAGIGMAARLALRSDSNFVVLERASEVGGTWRDNTYPGAACDIRSDLYSFSFAPNPDWTRRYSPQPEILQYLRDVAERFGLRANIRFGTELTDARWDAARRRWTLTTNTGAMTADYLVSGGGPLIDPVMPDIPGIDTFAGELFHSARWNHAGDLAGKRIGVIGTGASAIQLVPQLQAIAARLTVFQRTPAWITPRADGPTSDRRRRLFRRIPALQRVARWWVFRSAEARHLGFRYAAVGRVFERVATAHLHRAVTDPTLRAELTPDYRIGCKRILVSNDFYPALTRPNVALVTESITRIEGATVVTLDGVRHELDALVCATGFTATRPSIGHVIHGRDGMALDAAWSPSMSALRGTTVVGFPNLFLLIGPNTALGHNSMIYIIESQLDYVLDAIDLAARAGGVIEARADAQERYNERVQSRLAESVWVTGGCTSYYSDPTGRNSTLWPLTASAFRRSLRSVKRAEFLLDSPQLAR